MDRPLATADRIMAGTFSSDDSETARRRAEEARRVIPGAVMGPQGPPEQQAMEVGGRLGACSGMPQTSVLAGPDAEQGLWDLPPVPPSALGYFVPLEGFASAAAPGSHGLGVAGTTTGQATSFPGGLSLGMPRASPLRMGQCQSMPGMTSMLMGSCPPMPPYLSPSGVASSSMGPCLPMNRVTVPHGGHHLEGTGTRESVRWNASSFRRQGHRWGVSGGRTLCPLGSYFRRTARLRTSRRPATSLCLLWRETCD